MNSTSIIPCVALWLTVISCCLYPSTTNAAELSVATEEVISKLYAYESSFPWWGERDTTLLDYRYYQNREYLEYQFEQRLRNEAEWQELQDNLREQSKDYLDETPLVIPVVFHVLYTDDVESAAEDIAVQLDALNRDFGKPVLPEKSSYDPEGTFAAFAGTPNLSFVAVDMMADATQVDGVAKIEDVREIWEDYDAMKAPTRGSPPIQPERYVNIWIVKPDDRLGSYASAPGSPSEFDGIVIDQRYFGRGSPDYADGKTLTHLMGNYLGLHDLWGYKRCDDDGVADTPIHNAPTIGPPRGKRISTCDGLPRAMTMNFMDGTHDAYQYMFTQGQVQRMRYVLSARGPRSQLPITP